MLSHSASDEELGRAVLEGLSASRMINPKQDPDFLMLWGEWFRSMVCGWLKLWRGLAIKLRKL